MFGIDNVLWTGWPGDGGSIPRKGLCLDVKPTRHCIQWVSGSLFQWLYWPCLEALS